MMRWLGAIVREKLNSVREGPVLMRCSCIEDREQGRTVEDRVKMAGGRGESEGCVRSWGSLKDVKDELGGERWEGHRSCFIEV